MKKLLVPLALLAAHDAVAGFACDLHALNRAEHARSKELVAQLKRMTRQRRPLADGFAFALDPSALLPAAEWMDLERRCCPFLDLELAQERDHGALWLRVRGAPGAAQIVEREL